MIYLNPLMTWSLNMNMNINVNIYICGPSLVVISQLTRIFRDLYQPTLDTERAMDALEM